MVTRQHAVMGMYEPDGVPAQPVQGARQRGDDRHGRRVHLGEPLQHCSITVHVGVVVDDLLATELHDLPVGADLEHLGVELQELDVGGLDSATGASCCQLVGQEVLCVATAVAGQAPAAQPAGPVAHETGVGGGREHLLHRDRVQVEPRRDHVDLAQAAESEGVERQQLGGVGHGPDPTGARRRRPPGVPGRAPSH